MIAKNCWQLFMYSQHSESVTPALNLRQQYRALFKAEFVIAEMIAGLLVRDVPSPAD